MVLNRVCSIAPWFFRSRSPGASWEVATGCLYWMMTLTILLELWSKRLERNSAAILPRTARSGSRFDCGAAAIAETGMQRELRSKSHPGATRVPRRSWLPAGPLGRTVLMGFIILSLGPQGGP